MVRNMSRTGRPRSTEADLAILRATRAALVEVGWGRLTMGQVAARAGVAKTTLYRRWGNKNELVVDAVAVLFDELELPDRGSLAADVEGVVTQFGALLERPEARTALMAVIAESAHDDRLRARIRESIVERQKHLVVTGRRRAQIRGELPSALMYCCGGDRAFFKEHNILPAEFLALVWRHENNEAAIVDWVVRRSAAK